MALVDPLASIDDSALLRDPRTDAVNVEVNIDAVGDGLLVAVLHHQVLVEEAERLLGGRGSQSDQEGVKVLENLAPDVVNGAVAFVDEDHVERLDGEARVIRDFNGLLAECGDR